jgi:ABC-type multidrug transport system fused ATPase/permease subunit
MDLPVRITVPADIPSFAPHRALLQGADLVVLDESFAALDPDSLRQSLDCAIRRAPTLLLIAHP